MEINGIRNVRLAGAECSLQEIFDSEEPPAWLDRNAVALGGAVVFPEKPVRNWQDFKVSNA
ncbi:MAG: hypothetical protein LBN38_03460 [Verrucomicrobiota bacterium]|jgi:hypothetical protein|nr:hypothetical protein [Verrucomicrobiota bacterium]